MDSILEIVQDFAPIAVVLCTSTVALVNDYEVKKFWFEQFSVVLRPLLPYQLLIEGEIDLVSSVGMLFVLLIIDLVDGVGKWFKILFDGLVYQHIPVGQI